MVANLVDGTFADKHSIQKLIFIFCYTTKVSKLNRILALNRNTLLVFYQTKILSDAQVKSEKNLHLPCIKENTYIHTYIHTLPNK
jgi:hypothetical protein